MVALRQTPGLVCVSSSSSPGCTKGPGFLQPAGSGSAWAHWDWTSQGLLSKAGLTAGLSAGRTDDYAVGE